MNLFQELRGLNGYDGKNSLGWFRNAAQLLRISGRNQTKENILTGTENKLSNNITLGKMYLFQYDPKHKDKLPYWDLFPLVFPINRYNDGFLGLNLHYLKPELRLIFFHKMTQFATDTNLNPRARMIMEWKMINNFTRFPEVEVCVKRYLASHITTRFLEIPANDWRSAVMLPLQSFQKQQAQSVWAQYNRKIK
jgi:hypothetical protein